MRLKGGEPPRIPVHHREHRATQVPRYQTGEDFAPTSRTFFAGEPKVEDDPLPIPTDAERHQHGHPLAAPADPRGGFRFDPGPAALRGTSTNNFQSFATLLMGLPAAAGRLKLEVAPYSTRSWQYSFSVRDQWQVTPRTTLSFGTQYEYFPRVSREDRGVERSEAEPDPDAA